MPMSRRELLTRGAGAVELTPAGRRFLPRARELLTTARLAVAEARAASRPLRADVWGQVHSPLRWFRRLNTPHIRFDVEISMRRSTLAAVDALIRNEIDVAFGRVPDGTGALPDLLETRLVYL